MFYNVNDSDYLRIIAPRLTIGMLATAPALEAAPQEAVTRWLAQEAAAVLEHQPVAKVAASTAVQAEALQAPAEAQARAWPCTRPASLGTIAPAALLAAVTRRLSRQTGLLDRPDPAL